MKRFSSIGWVKKYQEENPGLNWKDKEVIAKAKILCKQAEERHYAEQARVAANSEPATTGRSRIDWKWINENGVGILSKIGALVLVAFVVSQCRQIKIEESKRTPEQIAAAEAAARQERLDERFKDLKSSARDVLRNYLLNTGDGYCDSLYNERWSSVRYGTAAYRSAKPEPSITGAYTVDCVYYILGEKKITTGTYWFHITMQERTGNREGVIRLENREDINKNLAQLRFRDAE